MLALAGCFLCVQMDVLLRLRCGKGSRTMFLTYVDYVLHPPFLGSFQDCGRMADFFFCIARCRICVQEHGINMLPRLVRSASRAQAVTRAEISLNQED